VHIKGDEMNKKITPELVMKILFLTAISIFLSACGEEAPLPEPVTIKFVHLEPDTEYYQTLAQSFQEKNPYITIELTSSETEDADVYIADAGEVPALVEGNNLLNMDALVDLDQSFHQGDFYPGVIEIFEKDGMLWGIPMGVNPVVAHYNRGLFDQAGIPYPTSDWTWNDFLYATYAISDPDHGVFGYVQVPHSFSDPLLFIYQHGGKIVDDLNNPTKTTFDDPLTIEAMEWYFDLIYEYNAIPSPEQIRKAYSGGDNGIYRGIYSNKVGIWFSSFAERGGRFWGGEWAEFPWGIAPLPRDAEFVTLGQVLGYVIAAQTTHPDACWLWIKFLSDQIPPGMVPPRKSLTESTEYEILVGEDAAATARASMENVILISPEFDELQAPIELFFSAFDDIINQRATPREALQNAQQESEL
jgi:multiple sugar transport system substrate-binding protein